MATVANIAEGFDIVDRKLCQPNRTGSATPISAVVPLYPSELYFDSTNEKMYRAIGISNTAWVAVDYV